MAELSHSAVISSSEVGTNGLANMEPLLSSCASMREWLDVSGGGGLEVKQWDRCMLGWVGEPRSDN